MSHQIAVYCSSSDAVASVYTLAARELGQLIGAQGHTLVWGGANVGLMGAVAEATQQAGGSVIGVIPQAIEKEKIVYQQAERMEVTPDLYERKKMMSQLADAFIALPGGFGTLEEILEVMLLKQIHLHHKPIVFVNTNHFYDHLFELFEVTYAEKVAKPEYRQLYFVADTPAAAMEYIAQYQPPVLPKKWFDKQPKR